MPIVWDLEHANKMFDELLARAGDLADTDLRDGLLAAFEDPCAGDIIRSIFCNSPFLTRCSLSDLPFLKLILEQGPDTGLGIVIDEIKDELNHEVDGDLLKRGLRVARKRVALLVALADITGTWSLERVTEALSDFADAATSAALSHLLRAAMNQGEIGLNDTYFPEYECGYFALAMGKYGARELNYSSDIDLIILFDPLKIDYRGHRSVQQFLVRMTRDLVAVLQDMTADGYVFRVDLRLRPDPGSTPIAIPYASGLRYYETRAAGWERAAMIKARPAIGDLALGRRFMAELVPFVWRPALDFWAQREMVKIKRQINQHRGGEEIGFHGHNIKLGRGGIREIEFFAQSHQLVHGGRDAYLRSTRTLDALSSLAEAGHISDETADALTEAYEFLRQLEHRLQMINDQQTQTLPSDDAGMNHIAAFMGYEDIGEFRATLISYMETVDRHYSKVLDHEAAPGEPRFQDLASIDGIAEDASILKELGFHDIDAIIGCLQRWRTAAYQSLRDERS
jgi:glutamate-ammonia-ligase adenylyltransferase